MSSDNLIYYDLLITNIENNNQPAIECVFNEQRSTPYLTQPELYEMSIIRFTIDTPAIPLFRPIIKSNQPDINATVYSLTLQNNVSGLKSQVFVEWAPQDIINAPPTPPSQTQDGLQDNYTGYYDCTSYAWFLKLINNAFETAATTLGIATSPKIIFDSGSQLFILVCDDVSYNSQLPNYYEIYMNKSLYQLFSAFPAINTSHGLTDGLNFKIITNLYDGFASESVTFNGVTYNGLHIYSEFPTISLWNCITSIRFTTNNLPIVPSNISNPILSQNGVIIRSGINPDTSRIITDLTAIDTYKPNLVYNPSAEYRQIELTGSRPLNDINIACYYVDREAKLYPFRLSSGSSCSMKILFTKKFKS